MASKILICSLWLASFFLLTPKQVSAESKFTVTFDLSYKIAENGQAFVTQNFILTNNTSAFFPAEYLVNFGANKVSNLKATDRFGPLEMNVSTTNASTQVRVKLPDRNVGLGKTLSWTLAYETTGIATKKGNLWEIFIPRPEEFDALSDYSIELYTPATFGSPYIFKPAPSQDNHVWLRRDLTGRGIFVAFAPLSLTEPYQVLDFKLFYHLRNTKLYAVETNIALPPDTSYQKVFLFDLSPRPVKVEADHDGNWLATFNLGPASVLDVTATGSAMVYALPQFNPGALPLDDLLLPRKFWESNSGDIRNLAKSLGTAANIYDFVVAKLNAERTTSGSFVRLGARGSLAHNAPVTSREFSDLFVALTRAAGIASREMLGYFAGSGSLSKDLKTDVLHVWAEFFDEKKNNWVAVDPAFAKATGWKYFEQLDNDHLVLAVNGRDSGSPDAAGTYKAGNFARDVNVTFHEGKFDPNSAPRMGLRANFPQKIISGFPASISVVLENFGQTPIAHERVSLSAQMVALTNGSQSVSNLLPFSSVTLTFPVAYRHFFSGGNDIITLRFSGGERTYPVTIEPIYQNGFLLTFGILTVFGIISLIAQIARGLFFQKR